MSFFLVLMSVLAATTLYLWKRLVRDPRLKGRLRFASSALLVAGLLLVAGVWFLRRKLSGAVITLVMGGAFLWLGLLWYLFLFVFGADLLRLLRATSGRLLRAQAREPDPERRLFLARTVAGTAALGTFGIGTVGVRSALGDVETPQIAVPLRGLPPALSGFRIALLSDIHVGGLVDEEFVAGIVARTNDLRPDAVAITGDLVDGSVDQLARAVAPLADLRSRCGSFFVTGNHEFYSGVDSWLRHLPSLGVRVLANERVSLGDKSPAGASFDLAGIHDPTGRGRLGGRHAPDLARALESRDPDRGLVLLAHQPRQINEARPAGVGLQLSGHTHGGQIWPFGALTALVQPYIRGLHQDGDTWIYVTKGTGFWGPPMRILAPPEITTIVLTPGRE